MCKPHKISRATMKEREKHSDRTRRDAADREIREDS